MIETGLNQPRTVCLLLTSQGWQWVEYGSQDHVGHGWLHVCPLPRIVPPAHREH